MPCLDIRKFLTTVRMPSLFPTLTWITLALYPLLKETSHPLRSI